MPVTPSPGSTPRRSRSVHPLVDQGAAYAWRLVGIGLAVAGLVWLLGQLLVVVVPIAIGLLLARALDPVCAATIRRGVKPALASVVTVVAFLVVVFGALGIAGVTVAGELDELGPTLSRGIDDIEDWLVDDSPFEISRADVDQWRQQASDAVRSFVGSGEGTLVSGAFVAVEVVVGGILALIVAFFALKDGRDLVAKVMGAVPDERRDVAGRTIRRGWDAAGGYLRGAALLGIVEGIAIGAALVVVGADLVAPVMVVTFMAAFVPIVGAILAGVMAVLVALVTAGPFPALIVAGVALVVQQLDNDLLAPVIYGRALRLHPLVILLGIGAGGALFGLVGTVFAVPALAVALNALAEFRSDTTTGGPDPAEPDPPVGPVT